MSLLGQRLSSWLELSFWQLIVRLLSKAGPARNALVWVHEAAADKHSLGSEFARNLFTALLGWALGFSIGLALTSLWF